MSTTAQLNGEGIMKSLCQDSTPERLAVYYKELVCKAVQDTPFEGPTREMAEELLRLAEILEEKNSLPEIY